MIDIKQIKTAENAFNAGMHYVCMDAKNACFVHVR